MGFWLCVCAWAYIYIAFTSFGKKCIGESIKYNNKSQIEDQTKLK